MPVTAEAAVTAFTGINICHPIPDGGDGGKGGDIVIRASHNLFTLYDFKYKQHIIAKSGANGSSNKKRGRNAEDTVILVPKGTLVLTF